MLHTGLHEDYHRPSDKADKINSAGLKLVASCCFPRRSIWQTKQIGRNFARRHAMNRRPLNRLVEQLAPVPAAAWG